MSEKRQLTRAEIVRRRRAERAARESAQSASHPLKPMVRVTSRTPTIPPAALQARRGAARRFRLSLGLPELRLGKPALSMPRTRADVNWRLISFLLTLALGTALYLAFTLPYFYVPAATVLGNQRLSREEINGVLGVTGQSIFTVQPEEVRTRVLLNYPELLTAQVNVYLPNHVYVTVTERQPVIFWEQEGEGYTWIDANGVAFRPRGVAEGLIPVKALDAPPAPAPSADADPLSPQPFISRELVEAIRALSPLVPANTTLTYSAADGFGWNDPRGWKVVFGASVHDVPLKAAVYQSLVESLAARGIRPVFISVEYPDGPFYRAADAEAPSEEVIVETGP
jgi:hypothetical protein